MLGINVKKHVKQWTAVMVVMMLMIMAIIQKPTAAHAATNTGDLNLKAKSAILVNVNTGQIIYNKNAGVSLPPASMSKMMTEYLVEKAIHSGKLNWNSKVNISDYAYTISQNRQDSNVPLRKDYQYTVKELYDAMAIYSANGATIALAEKLGGSEKNFVHIMNQSAKKLGMQDAKFVNSTGLNNSDLGKFASVGGPNADNLMSAKSLAKLAYHIVKDYPSALNVTKIPLKNFTAGVTTPIQMVNWNWMLPGFGQNMHQYTYPGVDGLKTGHTDTAGYCFTGTVKHNGVRFISVVMGTNSIGARFEVTRQLYDYGFNQFSNQTVLKKGQVLKGHSSLMVTKGKSDKTKIALKNSLNLSVKSGNAKNLKPVFHLDQSKLTKDGKLTAPIKKGEQIGYVTLKSTSGQQMNTLSGQNIKVPVIATQQVDKANWFVLMMRAIGHFIGGVFSSGYHWVQGLFK